jgi:hypothetical protein
MRTIVSWTIWLYLGVGLALAYLVISKVGPVLNNLTSHLIGY